MQSPRLHPAKQLLKCWLPCGESEAMTFRVPRNGSWCDRFGGSAMIASHLLAEVHKQYRIEKHVESTFPMLAPVDMSRILQHPSGWVDLSHLRPRRHLEKPNAITNLRLNHEYV